MSIPEIINTPIKDVKIIKNIIHSDERGYFSETYRMDWNILKQIAQISRSETKPGIIKAFHLHKKQNEVWHYVKGRARVVLHDLRENSETFGKTLELNFEKEMISLYIPAGVAHGYQILGEEMFEIIYIADTCYSYDNPDEIRIPHDDKGIGFDWSNKE